jgi:hypothetical protein
LPSSLLLLLLVLLALDAAAVIVLVGAESSKRVERLSLLVLGGDLDELNGSGLLLDGKGDADGLSVSGLKLVGGRVSQEALLGLVLAAREEHELACVGLESLHVQIKLLLRGGGSSVIYGDSDGFGVSGGHTSGLEFLQGEATAKTDLASVLAGRLGHDGTQGVGGSGENAGSLGLSDLVSLRLLGSLVEVGLHTNSFPVLAKMHVDNHVVMLDHC